MAIFNQNNTHKWHYMLFEKLLVLLLQTELFFEFTCFSSISKIYNNLSSYSHI